MAQLFGIDLGGTKIEGVVLDSEQGYAPISRIRLPTERDKGYQHILNRIEKLVGLLIDACGSTPTAIGIGTPGALDPDSQTIKNSNTTCLIGQSLKKDLEQLLGVEIFLANDANCFALAEATMGVVPSVYRSASVVFGVILGTGVGGGIVVNGSLIHGRHGIGGEWGHNFLDVSGGHCYCGQAGCVETILSGPSAEAFYQQESGEERLLKDIVVRNEQGNDPLATKTIDRYLHFFGKALAPVINLLDPDVIVLGGGVGNIELLYSRGREEVAKYVFNPVMRTEIVKPQLGDSAGVFGAALLVES